MPPKSTLVCLLQRHLSMQHKHNLRLGVALRFPSPSSWASIIVFSSWYLFCGAAQFILQNDSLYYLFSAMICFSTFGVSGQMCAHSCPSKALIPTHSFCCVIPAADQPILQSNAFAWETKDPPLLSVNFQLPNSLNMQEHLNWNFHMPRNTDFQ